MLANGGHAPTICNTWFRGWSSFHYFLLPDPKWIAEARIPLEGKIVNVAAENRTFHELIWMKEARQDMNIPKDVLEPNGRSAFLLNFGVWWNIGRAANIGLKLEDDSPAHLYGSLKLQFEEIAAAHQQSSSPPLVFWRETAPELFPSFPVARSQERRK